MSDIWLVNAAREPVVKGRIRPLLGRRHLSPVNKLLWHTTEGSTIAGAVGEYRRRAGWSNGVQPHLTVDPARRLIVQHVPLNRSAYSLADWNDRRGVIQVEVVGFAAETGGWPTSWFRWLGTTVAAPVVEAFPAIHLWSYPAFHGAGEGIVLASPDSPIRMGRREFTEFAGQLGHQHAPAPDDHWDPGVWDPVTIAEAARRVAKEVPAMEVLIDTTTKEYWVTVGNRAWLLSDPTVWMEDWNGEPRRSKTMRFVVPQLYQVVSP